ncbi:hypothetical protein [Dyadobacter sandarakinus]|uniref:Uncharacterized protein n=1 Tax=Dyadobacter sandarakinus TaxID=2747268 RepID=A0ABX7IBZ5_9BACT|nr:hypothetical protein [Dyadobacter sandarakinus]QRR03238.1 hypothetical protein HWI92_21130 [Dyadobacter sandarakinus]
MKPVLIIGKVPPPVGGVAVHVARLVAGLSAKKQNFYFCNLRKTTPVHLAYYLIRYQIIHLHTSNPWFQLSVAVFSRIFSKTLMITYHGNWGRYHALKNLAVRLSARLCRYPLVQNKESLAPALSENPNARCIPVYIASDDKRLLPESVSGMLTRLRLTYKYVFCTHAWNVAFDKYGREIYGISELAAHLRQFPRSVLVVADPSGRYRVYLEKIMGKVPDNVLIMQGSFDFRSILDHCDGFIRNTTTDGSCISIEEALAQHKVVLASNAVSRSPGCRLFSDVSTINLEWELLEGMRAADWTKVETVSALDSLITLYKTTQLAV